MSVPDSDSSSKFKESAQIPRQELVDIATKFLKNPKIQQSPLVYKQKFLKSKGLTDEEISIAVSRSSTALPEFHTSIAIPPQQALLPQQSFWSKFRDFGNGVALIGGLLYGLYLFYKKFIHPFLFGRKKKKSVEEYVAELEASLTVKVQSVQDDVKKANIELAHLSSMMQNADAATRHIQDLKTEFSSLKSILLSGSQFPVLKTSPLSPTAIPKWQQTSKEDTSTQPTSDSAADEACGSGSGSSDPEMINNNGSDSSLELIRE